MNDDDDNLDIISLTYMQVSRDTMMILMINLNDNDNDNEKRNKTGFFAVLFLTN